MALKRPSYKLLRKCEKLIHGDREYKPTETFGYGVKETEHPYRCARLAKNYEVRGQSFTAFAVLCKTHKAAAEHEGFILIERGE